MSKNKGERQGSAKIIGDAAPRDQPGEILREIEIRAKQQAVVAEIGQLALAGTDLCTLMDVVVRAVSRTLGVEYCKVLELLPDVKALRLKAGTGWRAGLVGHETIEGGAESQAGYTLFSNEPVIVEDLRTETRFRGPQLLYDHGVVSGMSVIIGSSENPFGVLGAHTTRSRKFTKDDVHFLQAVANVLAYAVEHKRTEGALLESEKRYKKLVESVTDYIYSVKVEEGRPVATSHGPGCIAVTGYAVDEYGADPYLWFRIVYEEDRDAVREQAEKILSGAAHPLEHRIIHKDGSIRWVKNTPVPHYDEKKRLIGYDGLITDITEFKKLEAQLRHTQKMEAVGQLAGGIAHDFSNILTAIIGYGSLLHLKMKDDDPMRVTVEQIIASAERAANLTQSLLAFSRKRVINPRPVNLNEIVRRVGKLLVRIIGEDIEVKTVLNPLSPVSKEGGEIFDLTVMADSGEIEQVLMNLCTNARDAMPEGGALTIETGLVKLGEEYIRAHGYGRLGTYALLTVTDTGTGIDEKTKSRIFEPFFTTREMGKGTGLGLSMAYGIVKQHNGYINVYSEVGKGTTIKIYLPIVKAECDETKPVQVTRSLKGTETILLVEDDEEVRNLTKEVLEGFGYKVIDAVDGEDGMNKFMESTERIELLILDVVMPKKNGKEVYEAIKAISPGIKVLFTSGYTKNIIHRKGIVEEGMDLIFKPLSPKELLIRVREALDKNR